MLLPPPNCTETVAAHIYGAIALPHHLPHLRPKNLLLEVHVLVTSVAHVADLAHRTGPAQTCFQTLRPGNPIRPHVLGRVKGAVVNSLEEDGGVLVQPGDVGQAGAADDFRQP